MREIFDSYPVIQIATDRTCAECRFGAGRPQGPQRLMRCVNPGHPTAGQFLRGPLACEGFEERAVVRQPAEGDLAPVAHATARVARPTV